MTSLLFIFAQIQDMMVHCRKYTPGRLIRVALILITSLSGQLDIHAQEVRIAGAMRQVMMGLDLSAHLRWDTVAREHLFGISPLGRLQGEVTIMDGQPYVSTVDGRGRVRIEKNWAITAPFGVYAQAPVWETHALEAPIRSESELQKVLEEVLQAKGYDMAKPVPFRVQGVFLKVDYHIISKPEQEVEHDHDLHDRAKKHFSVKNVKGELLGFYSRSHEGVFTHRGSYVHIHFIDKRRKHMGHIEGVEAAKGQKLLLPGK